MKTDPSHRRRGTLFSVVILTCTVWTLFPFGLVCSQEESQQKKAVVQTPSSARQSLAKEDADKVIARLEAQIKKQKEDLELLKLFASSLAEIERSYVQKVDRRRLIEAAIDGMLHDLDRYSDYIPPAELDSFQTDIESEYGGIGIRVVKNPDEDYITVTTPILGSPSYKAGIEAESKIIKIAGEDAKGFSVQQAIDKIKGEIGSKVMICCRSKTGEEKQFEVERAIVNVKTVLGDLRRPDDQWDYFLRSTPELKKQKIGYVRINNFGRQTAKELERVIKSLLSEGMQGLIIDLRFNPGGLLSAAIDISDLFVEKGLIVRTEGRNARPRKWLARKNGTLPQFPLAVLVNHRSASASEIVAACLKDSGRAIVVGQRTFGKGSVQNIVKLEQGKSVMKLTTAAYYRPNGQNINRMPNHNENDIWGVKPSPGFEVPFDEESQRQYFEYRRNRDVIRKRTMKSESRAQFDDRQLKAAVRYLQGELKKRENQNSPAKKPADSDKL